MEKETQNLIDLSVRDAILGYELMNAADIFFRRSEKYSSLAIGSLSFGQKHKMTKQRRLIEAVIKEFDNSSCSVDNAIYKSVGAGAYDKIRGNAYEMARLLQIYYNVAVSPESAKSINKFLMRMHSNDMFSMEEIMATKSL